MKKICYFLFLFILPIIFFDCTTRTSGGGMAGQGNNPLIGTWKLISSNNSSPEGEFFRLDSSNTRQMKILNPTHFMYIQERISGNDREFLSAAGGRYELKEGTYTELFDYASWEDYKDTEAVFTWRIDGNMWYHKGVLNTADGENFMIEEVWERVIE